MNFSVAHGIGPGTVVHHRLEEEYKERGRGQASIFPLSTVQNGKEIYLHNLGEIFGIYLMGKVKREFQIYDQNEVCGSILLLEMGLVIYIHNYPRDNKKNFSPIILSLSSWI